MAYTWARLSWPLMALAVLSMCGCRAAYTYEDAPFVGYNFSVDNVEVIVEGAPRAFVPAKGTQPFTVSIRVPRPRWYSGSQPSSQDDEVVSVRVAFRNLRTDQLVGLPKCVAGVKVTTTVVYDSAGRPSCDASNIFFLKMQRLMQLEQEKK